jgi:spore maturation protein CgeB
MVYVASLAMGPDRDSGWIRQFAGLGWQVIPFSSHCSRSRLKILAKVQARFHVGGANREMQRKLLDLVAIERPLWVHFRLPVEFDRETILEVKKRGPIVTQYFNDDAFSRNAPTGLNWKFLRALSAYDGHFVFRAHNVESYRRAGARLVEHCAPSYDPDEHNPSRRRASFLADAAFVGHWEDDWRMDCLDALHGAGFSVILKGGLWEEAIKGRSLSKLSPISHAFGEEYNRIYANVIAGLCFFSKINNDTWTRRALEIIAVGGLLVCERTREAEAHFADRKEAFFFSSTAELVDIVRQLKSNTGLREKIREAGYRRLLAGSHSLEDRAAQIDRFVRSRLDQKH